MARRTYKKRSYRRRMKRFPGIVRMPPPSGNSSIVYKTFFTYNNVASNSSGVVLGNFNLADDIKLTHDWATIIQLFSKIKIVMCTV